MLEEARNSYFVLAYTIYLYSGGREEKKEQRKKKKKEDRAGSGIESELRGVRKLSYSKVEVDVVVTIGRRIRRRQRKKIKREVAAIRVKYGPAHRLW